MNGFWWMNWRNVIAGIVVIGAVVVLSQLFGCDAFRGPTGATGAQGPAGINGTDGIDGINGTDGVDGLPGVGIMKIIMGVLDTTIYSQSVTAKMKARYGSDYWTIDLGFDADVPDSVAVLFWIRQASGYHWFEPDGWTYRREISFYDNGPDYGMYYYKIVLITPH